MCTPCAIMRVQVSKNKLRYDDGTFDLDLSYITPRLIAMAYPSSGKEALYRNPARSVRRFMEARHGDNSAGDGTPVAVYNLCSERSYEASLLAPSCSVHRFPFDDHNTPSLALMRDCCEHMATHMAADEQNVCAVHCKAGKGRTGTIVCAYLVHSGAFGSAEEAMAFYAEKRTSDGKGVTIPSQRRYVSYYARMALAVPLAPPPRAVLLARAVVVEGPASLSPSVRVMQRRTGSTSMELVAASGDASIEHSFEESRHVFTFRASTFVEGDVRVQVFRGPRADKKAMVGYTWLQTGYEALDSLEAARKSADADVARKVEEGAEVRGMFAVVGKDVDKCDESLRSTLSIEVVYECSWKALDPPGKPWERDSEAIPRALSGNTLAKPPVSPEPTVAPKKEPTSAAPASAPRSGRAVQAEIEMVAARSAVREAPHAQQAPEDDASDVGSSDIDDASIEVDDPETDAQQVDAAGAESLDNDVVGASEVGVALDGDAEAGGSATAQAEAVIAKAESAIADAEAATAGTPSLLAVDKGEVNVAETDEGGAEATQANALEAAPGMATVADRQWDDVSDLPSARAAISALESEAQTMRASCEGAHARAHAAEAEAESAVAELRAAAVAAEAAADVARNELAAERERAAGIEAERVRVATALSASEAALTAASEALTKEQGSFVSKLRAAEAATAEAVARSAALGSELRTAKEETNAAQAARDASALEVDRLTAAVREGAAKEGDLLRRVADLEGDLACVRSAAAESARERAAQEAAKALMRERIESLTESVSVLEAAAARGAAPTVVQGVQQEVHDEVMGALRESITRMQSLMEALCLEQERNGQLNTKIQGLIADVVAGDATGLQQMIDTVDGPVKAMAH